MGLGHSIQDGHNMPNDINSGPGASEYSPTNAGNAANTESMRTASTKLPLPSSDDNVSGMPAQHGDESLCDADRNLMNSGNGVSLTVLDPNDNKKIIFQFMPRIISESNKAEFQSHNMVAFEPIRVHMGSQGRTLVMEWEYISTSSIFTPPVIAKILRICKSYFF